MTNKLNKGTARAKMKIEEGDIFYVYNDYYKKYFFGKILVDIANRLTKHVEESWSSIGFFSDCYLVAVYKDIPDTPELHNREFIIPGSFIYKSEFNRRNKDGMDWVYYDHEDIDYHTLEFPEYLIASDYDIYLERGELSLLTGLTREQYGEEYHITGSKTGSLDFSKALLLQGYKTDEEKIDYHDLRLLPDLRKTIYAMIGEDPKMSYYDLALKHGKDLGRFYKEGLPDKTMLPKKMEIDKRTGYPKELLCGVAWTFRQEKFLSLAAFTKELKEYNEDVSEHSFSDIWSSDLKLIGNRILVQYEHWDNSLDDSREEQLLLQADNGKYFTTAELLYKIHNQIHNKLVNDDNVFFEGLQLFERDDANYPNIPYYYILQGS